MTGDNGPDQIGTRNSIHSWMGTISESESTVMSRMLFFRVHCLKHNYHLAAQTTLKICDKILSKLHRGIKYFTSLATLSHTWRSHLAKIRRVWWEQHEGENNVGRLAASFRMPPLAIAGRWASVDGISDRRLDETVIFFLSCLVTMMVSRCMW